MSKQRRSTARILTLWNASTSQGIDSIYSRLASCLSTYISGMCVLMQDNELDWIMYIHVHIHIPQ